MKKLFASLFVLAAFLWGFNVAAQIIVPAGNITTNTNWTNNNSYLLDGFVYVKPGVTLTIQAGTIIKGAKTPDGSALGFRVGTLIIEPGAKIIANGTETQPIIFTSQKPAGIDPNTSSPYRQPGDWGGVVICGYGAVNISGGIGTAEGGLGTQYGWGLAANPFGVNGVNSNTDSSGVLRYVRIEFPGIPLTTQLNSEINGLTLYGVGNKTVIEHIQVSFSGDDAFEWFGGAVNAKYLIALGTWDDDFDTDLGFSGKIQFAVGQRYGNLADQSGSNGFESDNDNLNSPQGSSNTPFTQPTFSNVSWFGPYSTSSVSPTPNALHQSAMHLRRNTKTSVYNSFFAGGEEGLRLDGTGTQANYVNGDLQLEQVTIAGWKILSDTTRNGADDATLLGVYNNASNNNSFVANNSGLNLNATSFNTVNFSNATLVRPDYRPQSNSVLLTGANAALFTNPRLQDPFFTSVNYRGAFGTQDWTACWSEFNPFATQNLSNTNNAINVVVSTNDPTNICQGNTVNIVSSATGNITGLAYSWSNGATTSNISVSASNSYNVTVTNSSGCTTTASSPVTVTVNNAPATPQILANGNTTFCDGGSVVLSAPTSTTYLWSNGATSESIVANASGTFNVTITDANGCSAASTSSVSVTENANPNAPQIIVNGDLSFCQGDDVVLTSSYATGNLWSNNATTQSITVSNNGSFNVTHTNANGCVSDVSLDVNTIVNALPTAPQITASGNTSFCTGSSVDLSSSYSTGNLWSNGATTETITVTNTGAFTVTYTDANGCSATSGATNTSSGSSPQPSVTVTGNTTFCQGNSVVLTSSSADTYLWSPGGATTQSITVTSAGTYTVSVTNTDPCDGTGNSTATVVTVNNAPSPTITASGNTTFCTGDSVELIAPIADAYLWSNNATTQNIFVSTAGTYNVSVTNANTCFGAGNSNNINVVVNAAPAPIVAVIGNTTFCDGGSVVLTASTTADSYLWTPGGATTQSISVTESGNYNVSVTNASNCSGAGSSSNVTVTVNDNPVANASINVINGLVVSFNNTTTGATTYTWDFGDGLGASLAATPTYTYGVAGDYTVTLTAKNANGCEDVTTVDVSVTVGIEEKEAFNSISLYPNPTANIANLNFNLKNESDIQVLVFDIAGKIIFDAKETNVLTGENNIAIDMINMNNGIYFVTIKADKAVVTKRLFVNK